jgi:hypothetical protein
MRPSRVHCFGSDGRVTATDQGVLADQDVLASIASHAEQGEFDAVARSFRVARLAGSALPLVNTELHRWSTFCSGVATHVAERHI